MDQFKSPSKAIVDDRPGYMDDDPALEQTPEEQAVADMVFQAYRENKKFKERFSKDWDKLEKQYAGDHWPTNRPDWKSSPVVNYSFAAIETIVPIMTDSNPTILVAPTEPSDSRTAEIIGQIMKRIMVSNRMQQKTTLAVRTSLIIGTSFMKVWWDQAALGGKGDVRISYADPRHVFPSPGALDVQDAANFIYGANIPINYIEAMYPEAKGRIKPGIWEEDLTVDKEPHGQGGGGVTGPVQSTDSTGAAAGSTTSWAITPASAHAGTMDRGKIATLLEMWHRKDGKVWLTVVANKVVLRDGPSPFTKHNKYPFIRLVDYDIPQSFWGMGELVQLEKLQESINKRRGQTIDILKICASPPLIADSNSGINPKAMVARPGTIIYKTPGTDVRWLQPPNLPAALFEIQQFDKKDFDAISGVTDITQGNKPAGIEAASAIIELQEAAQTRIRLKVRNLETFLTEVGEIVIPTMQQFYKTERVIRIVGGNPSKPEFITVNGSIVDSQGNQVKINDITVGEFDVEVGVGSTMPVNKSRYYKQMMEMFGAGIVDEQAVIESSILPPTEVNKILQRRKEQQQQIMQMEQGGGQPPAPEGQGGQSGPSEEQMSKIGA